MCGKCNDTGKVIGGYCTCPRGTAKKLKDEFYTRKSVEKPDLIKRYSDFDLMK